MKDFAKIFAAGAVLLTAMVACTKEQEPAQNTSDPDLVTLTFVADNTLAGPGTKTVLGDAVKDDQNNIISYNVNWSSTGEKVRFLEVVDNATSDAAARQSNDAVIGDDGKATFSASFSAVEGDSHTFKYYSVYPNSACMTSSNKNVSQYKIYSFSNDNGVQTPAINSYDPNADRLISLPVESNTQKTSTPLSLKFKRISALGMMTVNGLDAEDIVNHISFIAPEGTKLDGYSSFNLTDGNKVEYCYTNSSNAIQLSYPTVEFKTGNTAYFMCWPETIDAGETFTVIVRTDKNTYVKNVTLGADKQIVFSEGEVSAFSVGMANNKVETKTIAEFNALEVGDTYYKITGTISDIADATYGNLTITSGEESIYVYGLTKYASPKNDKSFESLGLKVGDVVSIVGQRSVHNNVAQVANAFYFSHTSGTVEETKYYVKVTSAPADWSGEYLIVSEDSSIAMDGSLTDFAVNNTGISVTIVDNTKILATSDVQNKSFTITTKTGGYSIKAKGGKYIGRTSSATMANNTKDNYTNNITINEDKNVLITAIIGNEEVTGSPLKYRSDENNTFRFYSTSTDIYKPIQLYKLED